MVNRTKYPGAIECLACRKVLVSFYTHDFKTCGCPNESFVDGGSAYLRVGGKNLAKIKLLKIISMPKRKGRV